MRLWEGFEVPVPIQTNKNKKNIYLPKEIIIIFWIDYGLFGVTGTILFSTMWIFLLLG